MTALYIRCDGCNKDFPEGASDFRDTNKLQNAATANGWTSDDHPSAYCRKHYCPTCNDGPSALDLKTLNDAPPR